MANNQNLKPAKKGEPSRNPHGRPPIPEAFKKMRALSKETFKKLGDALVSSDLKTLERAYKDGTIIERAVASIMLNIIKKGDMSALNILLPWLIGKVPDKVEVLMPKPTVIHRRDGSTVVLGLEDKKDDQ